MCVDVIEAMYFFLQKIKIAFNHLNRGPDVTKICTALPKVHMKISKKKIKIKYIIFEIFHLRSNISRLLISSSYI